jgi:hypothetical protein
LWGFVGKAAAETAAVNGLNVKVRREYNLDIFRRVRRLKFCIRNWVEVKPLCKLPIKERMFCPRKDQNLVRLGTRT